MCLLLLGRVCLVPGLCCLASETNGVVTEFCACRIVFMLALLFESAVQAFWIYLESVYPMAFSFGNYRM